MQGYKETSGNCANTNTDITYWYIGLSCTNISLQI